MKIAEKMTKAQIVEKIENIPADMLNSAVTAIRYSNPLNAISTNRVNVYIRSNRVTKIEFQSRATKANMLNVYGEILNHIALWYGIEEARKIEANYTPAWYDEEEAPAAEAEQQPTETTTNEQKEEDNTMSNTANELQKYVDGIAADMRKLYEADPTDEEREAAEENGDACDLYSYFEDALDIEYTISSRGDYLGARIAVALGGPNIYIDTREGEVKGYWGTDRAERWIPSEICEEIDSIMEEYYSIVRGA